jgi:hypothetical protein
VSRISGLLRAAILLPTFVGLLVSAIGTQVGTDSWLAEAQVLEPDQCLGDERISFAPPSPAADEELLIAVTSARMHRGVYLTGTTRPTFRDEYTGQQGTVWRWVATPSFAGLHHFQFFVDSTVPCGEAWINVGPSNRPAAQASPSSATDPSGSPQMTPTPVVVFVTLGHDNGSDNGSDDNGSDDNGNSDNGGGNNASKPSQPRLDSLSVADTCPGAQLTLSGANFGRDRAELSGKVVIAGAEVRDYLSWSRNSIVVLVPSGATTQPAQSVFVITAGGYAVRTANVNPAPC